MSRYVLSIRHTGLGDRIICLGAAWRYARLTGRTLIADWRHGAYGEPGSPDQFATCFEVTPALAGVPFVGRYRHGQPSLPKPRLPAVWDDDDLLALPSRPGAENDTTERDAAVALIRSGTDVAAPVVVFDACVNDGLVDVAEARTFLEALRPVPAVAAAVDGFVRQEFGEGPAIGLHVRHGNGAPTGHARYWDDFSAALRRCERAVAAARERLGGETPVLLCTDSALVERVLHARLGRVLVRAKRFLAVGKGEMHLGPGAFAGRRDALVEMLLLARCAALVRYPPGSFFSFPAAVLKPSVSSAAATLYELQAPWDTADPLSPALLV
ncbi:MAG: nodulation protein NodZ [Geminicoccaceae bacterium]